MAPPISLKNLITLVVARQVLSSFSNFTKYIRVDKLIVSVENFFAVKTVQKMTEKLLNLSYY